MQVQQNSVRRMVKMKHRMDALLGNVRRSSGGLAELGEVKEDNGGVMSSHEVQHVLSWKPEPLNKQRDTFPSFKDTEAPKTKKHKPPDERELGQGWDPGEDGEVKKFVDRGLKAGVLSIKRGLYEELESARDLDGNVHELSTMVAKITQHVSQAQTRHVNDLGAGYFLSSKVRKAHHRSDAAKVGRAQLRKLAGVDKFNQFMISENKFAENRLKAMIGSLKVCSKSIGREITHEPLPKDTVEVLSQAGKHLNGLLKRQAHVARQALRKCDGLKTYIKKIRKQLDKHELTPKQAGILP